MSGELIELEGAREAVERVHREMGFASFETGEVRRIQPGP